MRALSMRRAWWSGVFEVGRAPGGRLGAGPVRRAVGQTLVIVLVGSARALAAEPKPAHVDFSRQVLPILSDNCFTCHGPDEKQRKAKLRLDIEEEAKQPAKSGDRPIVPGDIAASGLVSRIRTQDEDDVMPPPKTGKKLTSQQIDLLARWVEEGAKYEKHWAFVPPRRPPSPEVKGQKWVRNDLDRYVLERLEQEKAKPSPEADKVTLIRRATLDLNGLPPTPQEIDAFLADKSPQAYEKVVDRLLASPRYGEQMARYWLDAARYADSHGYHIDAERQMWKWRDWVIEAFNRNLPFDRFTTEQLAGDLLPDATVEQQVASGYIRANMSTGEGGAIEDEYLAKYTFDRTETAGTIWMGLTLTCARCHSHKYDPVSQTEYYGLYAFFNNLDEPVMDGNKPNPDPFLKLPTEDQRRRQAWLKERIDVNQPKLDAPRAELDTAQEAWVKEWRQRLAPVLTTVRPESAQSTNGTKFTLLEDASVLASGKNPSNDVHEVRWRVPAGLYGGLRLEALPHESLPHAAAGRADDGTFRLSGFEVELLGPTKDGQTPDPKRLELGRAFADVWDGEHEPGRAIDDNAESAWAPGQAARGQPHTAVFLFKEPVSLPEGASLRARLSYEASKERHALGRFRLSALGGEATLAVIFPEKPPPWKVIGPFKSADAAAGLATVYGPEEKLDFGQTYPGARNPVSWQERSDLPDGQRHVLVNELHGVHGAFYLHRVLNLPADRRVEFTLRADDVFRFWLDGQVVAERTAKEKPSDGPARVPLDLKAGEHRLLVKVVNYQGESKFSFNVDLDGADRLPVAVAGVLLASAEPSGPNAATVRNYFRKVASPEWRQLAEQVSLWRDEDQAIDQLIVTTLVAKERKERRETRMLIRGEYDKVGDVVQPGVPGILPPFPAGAPTNRLGLARWLLDSTHPLTARVTVNRFWQQYFGTGLVKTAEDFGVQGERPSHPELLDWLATEFVQSGWDVRHLQRLIVTSATYRQSSKWRGDLAARDPENRLLGRGPRLRTDAEVVRDLALAVSGLLVEDVGGRSVRPYEPPGLWEVVSFNNSQKYVQDRGTGNYRRSLYTHWKRQSPPPYMLLFDAPTREYCVVRRPRTNTPLQALALLNDPQFVEASRAFAQRMLTEGGHTAEQRLAYGFRLATARRPGRGEIKILKRVLDQQLAEFAGDPGAAEQLLSVGAFQVRSEFTPAELAAWSTVASLLLNLDETVTKG